MRYPVNVHLVDDFFKDTHALNTVLLALYDDSSFQNTRQSSPWMSWVDSNHHSETKLKFQADVKKILTAQDLSSTPDR
jgi:hypothetical protein